MFIFCGVYRSFFCHRVGHFGIFTAHDYESIIEGLNKAKECKGKPSILIAKTVKGKGVSFMENNGGWHGVAPIAEETEKALAELNS